jgi:hypothetical protein
MKNIKKHIFALSLILTFFNTNVLGYSQEERIKDMQIMEQGLQQMQKGFLYNNLQDIQKGAELLKKHTAKIEPPVDEKTNAFKKSYAYDLTKREAKKIIKLAEDAVAKYKERRTKQAMNSFAKILKQCMTCHTRIRKW